MIETTPCDSEPSGDTVAGVLSPLWEDTTRNVAKDAGLLGTESPNIDDLIAKAGIELVLNANDVDDNKYFVPETFTREQRRFFLGSRVAAKLTDSALTQCDADHGNCPQGVSNACGYLRRTFGNETDHRNAVLGSMLLIPEGELRKVEQRFPDDLAMVATTFNVPLVAAYLRLKYNEASVLANQQG